MFEKSISKYVEVNHRGTYTQKIFQEGKVKPYKNSYLEIFSIKWRNPMMISLYLENIQKG